MQKMLIASSWWFLEIITFIFKIISTHFQFFFPPILEKMFETSKVFSSDLCENFNDLRKKYRKGGREKKILKWKMKNLSVPFQINRGMLPVWVWVVMETLIIFRLQQLTGKSISNEQTRKFQPEKPEFLPMTGGLSPYPATKLYPPQKYETWKKLPELFSKIPQKRGRLINWMRLSK